MTFRLWRCFTFSSPIQYTVLNTGTLTQKKTRLKNILQRNLSFCQHRLTASCSDRSVVDWRRNILSNAGGRLDKWAARADKRKSCISAAWELGHQAKVFAFANLLRFYWKYAFDTGGATIFVKANPRSHFKDLFSWSCWTLVHDVWVVGPPFLKTSHQHTGRICPRVVLSALPVCERDFQISLREGVGLPRLADKQTMANSVGGKSLCTRLEFQGVTVCIEPINKIC